MIRLKKAVGTSKLPRIAIIMDATAGGPKKRTPSYLGHQQGISAGKVCGNRISTIPCLTVLLNFGIDPRRNDYIMTQIVKTVGPVSKGLSKRTIKSK